MVHLLKLDRNAFKLLLGPLVTSFAHVLLPLLLIFGRSVLQEDVLKKKVASYEQKEKEEVAYELRQDIRFEDLKVARLLF